MGILIGPALPVTMTQHRGTFQLAKTADFVVLGVFDGYFDRSGFNGIYREEKSWNSGHFGYFLIGPALPVT